jgi:hypothetical protein
MQKRATAGVNYKVKLSFRWKRLIEVTKILLENNPN